MFDVFIGLVQLAAAAVLFFNVFWLPKEMLFVLAAVLGISALLKLTGAALEKGM